MSYLKRWGITFEVLEMIVAAAPSLRGMLFGYVAEHQLKKWLFPPGETRISPLPKPDDHDRKSKGDVYLSYKGRTIKIESKCLQTNSVKNENGLWSGIFQCDASDRREVILPTGQKVSTTCLLVGEFDIVAVGLFQFGEQWRFAFAKNCDLPHPPKMAPEIAKHLIKSSIAITWPLKPPFSEVPFPLFDEIVSAKLSETP